MHRNMRGVIVGVVAAVAAVVRRLVLIGSDL
jgi:hypothetical protein